MADNEEWLREHEKRERERLRRAVRRAPCGVCGKRAGFDLTFRDVGGLASAVCRSCGRDGVADLAPDT